MVEETSNICPECNQEALVTDPMKAERFCEACGIVMEEGMIDEGPEWREFSSSGRYGERSRVGNPMTLTLHDKGLSTEIERRNVDSSGKGISRSQQNKMRRVRLLHNRSRMESSRQRNLMVALTELNKLASKLSIPRETREEAALIYRKAVDKSLIRGRSINGIMVASLYIACRNRGAARSLDEMCKISSLPKKEVGRNVRVLMRTLEIRSRPTVASDFIPKIVSDLELPHVVQARALEVVEEVQHHETVLGKSPLGVAASVIYMVSVALGHKRTQKQISRVAGVTEVTLRSTYRVVEAALGERFPELRKKNSKSSASQ